MKLEIIAVAFCSVALGACATQQYQSAANTEADAVVVAAQEPSEAGDNIADADAAVATDEGSPDRTICKRVINTGTRFAKRTCRTWSEWVAMEERSQDMAHDIQRRARGFDNSQ